jgi:hypothetical protein
MDTNIVIASTKAKLKKQTLKHEAIRTWNRP